MCMRVYINAFTILWKLIFQDQVEDLGIMRDTTMRAFRIAAVSLRKYIQSIAFSHLRISHNCNVARKPALYIRHFARSEHGWRAEDSIFRGGESREYFIPGRYFSRGLSREFLATKRTHAAQSGGLGNGNWRIACNIACPNSIHVFYRGTLFAEGA